MLSRKISTSVRENAINALYNRRDVFIHNWTEACATTCALRIMLQEELEMTKNKGKNNYHQEDNYENNNNKNKEEISSSSSTKMMDMEEYFSDILQNFEADQKFRNSLREALFRIHVPRTISPTRVSESEYWAPLRISSSSSNENQKSSTSTATNKNVRPPPFSDEEFQQWIERTSNFSKSMQLGGELYVPLPAFLSSFQSLLEYRTRLMFHHRRQNQQNQKQQKQNHNQESDYYLLPPLAHQNLHPLTAEEVSPQKDLIQWFVKSGEKSRFDSEIAESRGNISLVLTPQQTKLLFRSCITLGGSIDLTFLSRSFLKNLSTGDILLVDESDAALKQFGSVLRRSAQEDHRLKQLTMRARTFNPTKRANDEISSSSSHDSPPPIEYDPTKTQRQLQRGLRGSGGNSNSVAGASSSSGVSNNNHHHIKKFTSVAQSFPPVVVGKDNVVRPPPKLPFSLRPGEESENESDSTNSLNHSEIDFNLCIFQTPVEPLFGDVLKSPKDWYEIYRRDLNSEGETRAVRVLKQLCEKMITSMNEDEENINNGGMDLPPNQFIGSSRTKELLMDFDSQLFQRISGDVGGYVVVIAPVFETSANDDDENGDSTNLLPKLENGRVGRFPEIVFSKSYSLASIWAKQFEDQAGKTRGRTRFLAIDKEEISKMLFDENPNVEEETDDESAKLLPLLLQDPFRLDVSSTTSTNQHSSVEKELSSSSSSSSFGLMTSEKMNSYLSLFEQFQKQEETGENSSSSSSAFALRLTVYKCPPGLCGSLHENRESLRSTDPRLNPSIEENLYKKSLKENLRNNNGNNQTSSSGNNNNNNEVQNKREAREARIRNKYSNGGSLVEFANTFEYDHYLPRAGPQFSYHWADLMPSFSYLDETHVGRRKAEIERRNQGLEPHKYSDILFPPHQTRTHALVNEGNEDPELNEELEDSSSDDRQYTSTTISPEELAALPPAQRNAFLSQEGKSNNKKKSRSSIAADKLRDAQLRFGTVGAIFKSDLKKKQLMKTAGKKQLLRSLDQRMSDERFFKEKVLPIGETTLMLERELASVRPRTVEQLARAKHYDRPKFGGEEHRALKLSHAAKKTLENQMKDSGGDGGSPFRGRD